MPLFIAPPIIKILLPCYYLVIWIILFMSTQVGTWLDVEDAGGLQIWEREEDSQREQNTLS